MWRLAGALLAKKMFHKHGRNKYYVTWAEDDRTAAGSRGPWQSNQR